MIDKPCRVGIIFQFGKRERLQVYFTLSISQLRFQLKFWFVLERDAVYHVTHTQRQYQRRTTGCVRSAAIYRSTPPSSSEQGCQSCAVHARVRGRVRNQVPHSSLSSGSTEAGWVLPSMLQPRVYVCTLDQRAG